MVLIWSIGQNSEEIEEVIAGKTCEIILEPIWKIEKNEIE